MARNEELWRRIRRMDDEPQAVEKWDRPVNLKEVREQIETTYAGMDWQKSERRSYEESIGLIYKPLADHSKEELNRIYNDMVSSRMILVK